MKRSNNSSPEKHIPVNRIGKVTAKQLKTWVSEVSRDVSKRLKDEQFEECAQRIRLLASRQNRKAAKLDAKVVSLNEPAFDTLCVQAPLFLNLRRAAIDFRSAMQALENGGGFIWPRDSGDISSVEISTELGKLQASIDAITAMLSVIGIPASRVDAKQDGRPKTNWAELGHAVGKEIRSLLLHVTGLKGLKLTYNHGIVPAISAHIVNHLFQIDIAGEGFAAQMRNRQRSKKIAPTKFGDRFLMLRVSKLRSDKRGQTHQSLAHVVRDNERVLMVTQQFDCATMSAPMKLIRYPDLVAKGVVNSRMTLKRLIDTQDFPPGVLITPNARAWDETAVDEWISSRPAARKRSTRNSARPDSTHVAA